uniref:Anosmin 1b n=1 Tax=Scleropages formosus TaxID=113540 RepID=A0A8C9RP31_SCLFO
MKGDGSMYADRVSLLVACCLLGCGAARRSGREDAATLERIAGARCASRCLALHMTQLSARFTHLQVGWIMDERINFHHICFGLQCLHPCKELWETKRRSLSQKACEKHHECATSAAFLGSLRTQKQGDCPPTARASGFAAACVESCAADRDCPGARKCCPNGCGHTCQAPANLYQGVPLRPRRDITFLEDQHGWLTVSWVSRFNVSAEPVLYILQRRWDQGIRPSEDPASDWQTVLMTMENQAVMKDLKPHRWYQFRVSAVNSQGTRGFTAPSSHFLSWRDPSPPAKPQNLRRAELRERPDGSVSVLVLWDPPKEDEVAVHHYRVSWRASKPRCVLQAVCEMELRDLRPDTAYVVQVQAVAYGGQKRMRSSRSQLTFATPSQGKVPASPCASNELPSSGPAHNSARSPALRLEAAAPHYHSHRLRVKVHWRRLRPETVKDSSTYRLRWSPEVCAHNETRSERTAIVQGTHFVITDLLFACKYRVAVKPLSGQSQRSEAVTSVITPPCGTLAGSGAKSVSCAGEERHPLVAKVPLRPEKLTAAFRTIDGSLRGEFGWRLSHAGPGRGPVAGLRFSLSPLPPDSLAPHTQLLPPDQNFLTVENIRPQSVYELQLQILSAGGSGVSVVKTLHTLQVNSAHTHTERCLQNMLLNLFCKSGTYSCSYTFVRQLYPFQ